MSDSYLYPPADPDIARIVEQLSAGLNDLPKTFEQCRQWLEQGYTLGELRGVTEEGYTALYQIACELCDQSDFHHALPIALQLVLHKPSDRRHPFIAGACLQRLGHTAQAALMYALACDLDPDDAASAYRLGECLLAVERPEEARPFLNKAVDLCYGKPHCRALMDRARNLLETRY